MFPKLQKTYKLGYNFIMIVDENLQTDGNLNSIILYNQNTGKYLRRYKEEECSRIDWEDTFEIFEENLLNFLTKKINYFSFYHKGLLYTYRRNKKNDERLELINKIWISYNLQEKAFSNKNNYYKLTTIKTIKKNDSWNFTLMGNRNCEKLYWHIIDKLDNYKQIDFITETPKNVKLDNDNFYVANRYDEGITKTVILYKKEFIIEIGFEKFETGVKYYFESFGAEKKFKTFVPDNIFKKIQFEKMNELRAVYKIGNVINLLFSKSNSDKQNKGLQINILNGKIYPLFNKETMGQIVDFVSDEYSTSFIFRKGIEKKLFIENNEFVLKENERIREFSKIRKKIFRLELYNNDIKKIINEKCEQIYEYEYDINCLCYNTKGVIHDKYLVQPKYVNDKYFVEFFDIKNRKVKTIETKHQISSFRKITVIIHKDEMFLYKTSGTYYTYFNILTEEHAENIYFCGDNLPSIKEFLEFYKRDENDKLKHSMIAMVSQNKAVE